MARPACCLYVITCHVWIPTTPATDASSHRHYSANSKRHLYVSKSEIDFKLQRGGVDRVHSQLHAIATTRHELLPLPPCLQAADEHSLFVISSQRGRHKPHAWDKRNPACPLCPLKRHLTCPGHLLAQLSPPCRGSHPSQKLHPPRFH